MSPVKRIARLSILSLEERMAPAVDVFVPAVVPEMVQVAQPADPSEAQVRTDLFGAAQEPVEQAECEDEVLLFEDAAAAPSEETSEVDFNVVVDEAA